MPSTVEQIAAKAEALKADFNNRWGPFRRWLSANPLSGFWLGFIIGSALIGLLLRLV